MAERGDEGAAGPNVALQASAENFDEVAAALKFLRLQTSKGLTTRAARSACAPRSTDALLDDVRTLPE